MLSCCNALTLICLQTLKVKVKILCDVFEKHESPPENGMLKVPLELVILYFIRENDVTFLNPEGKESTFIVIECSYWPFLSCLVPLFQNESSCKTIHVKISLICMSMKQCAEHVFILMLANYG